MKFQQNAGKLHGTFVSVAAALGKSWAPRTQQLAVANQLYPSE
jgi:hypothetical protein